MRRGVPVQSVRQEKEGNSSFLRLLFCSGPYETGDWPPDWGEQSAPVSPWIQMQSPPGSALIDTPRTCLLGAQGQLGCHMRVTATRLLLDSYQPAAAPLASGGSHPALGWAEDPGDFQTLESWRSPPWPQSTGSPGGSRHCRVPPACQVLSDDGSRELSSAAIWALTSQPGR